MAEAVGQQTRFNSLELSISSGTGHPFGASTLAFSRDGVPLPAEDNPKTIFNRLFGQEAGGIAAQRARLTKRRSVLDAVFDDANAAAAKTFSRRFFTQALQEELLLRPIGNTVYLMPPYVISAGDLSVLTSAIHQVLLERTTNL